MDVLQVGGDNGNNCWQDSSAAFTPQPLRAVRVFFSTMVSRWAFVLVAVSLITKIYGLLQLFFTPINKFYSFIIFSLLINAVILLLNGLVLILYIHFLSLRHYFLYLNIIWTFIELTLLEKYPDLCTVSVLLYLIALKTISPRASFMLFFSEGGEC